ncbi:MAG: ABC transporter permease [Sulfolobaceae archaeon]|nr:ABC transporter permease [Sulfolobales archaeon]
MRRVIRTSIAIIKDNLNSPIAVFFVLLFPVMLALTFALGFGGLASSLTVPVYVSGHEANGVARALNATGLFSVHLGGNTSVVKFGAVFVNVTEGGATIYYPPYAEKYVSVVEYSVASALSKANYSFSTVRLSSPYSYQAYVLTGTIGAMVMSNGVFGVTGVAATYYRDKLIERLAASPLKDYEWALSLMIYEVVISFASAIAIGLAGLAIGVPLRASLALVAFVVLGTFVFAGLGAVIYGLTPKDRVFLANTVATVVTFPLMFASNSFYPSYVVPMPFRLFVEYQPLSLFNDVLRSVTLGVPTSPYVAMGLAVGGLAMLGIGINMLKLRE